MPESTSSAERRTAPLDRHYDPFPCDRCDRDVVSEDVYPWGIATPDTFYGFCSQVCLVSWVMHELTKGWPDGLDEPLPQPAADLVMVVDKYNAAHVLKPGRDRPIFSPTLCGGRHDDLAALYDLLDTLAAPWSLLTNPKYRAWPPSPCQTCLRLVTERQREAG